MDEKCDSSGAWDCWKEGGGYLGLSLPASPFGISKELELLPW